MDLYESIQWKALKLIINPENEEFMNHVFRFYSKTFHTPLHIVRDLPLEDVLLAYYEELYVNMSEEEREETIHLLLLTPEERILENIVKKDEEFLDNLNKSIEESETIEQARGKIKNKNKKSIKQLAEKIQKIKEKANSLEGGSSGMTSKKKAPIKELPNINMNFNNNLNNKTKYNSLDPLNNPKK